MYCYWMIFLFSDGTLMSSASVVHGILCFPNILNITYITCHDIYYIAGFAMEIFSYGGKSGWLYWRSLGRCSWGAG